MDLQTILLQFAALAGFAALVAVVVNTGKKFGVVKDGQAPTYSLVLNVVGFVALGAVRIFAPKVDVPTADANIGQVAQILVLVLGLVGQLGASKVANAAVVGMPLIGYSHSLAKAKALALPPSAWLGADHPPYLGESDPAKLPDRPIGRKP